MARPASPEAQLARVMTHPLRPRIMALLTVRGELSPNETANELGERLGTVSYHMRILRDAGWIELVRTEPRRGALEHFYRAVVRASLENDEWDRLPLTVRRRLAAMTVGQILRSAAEAAPEGGFDRPEAHVARVPLELDEQGWSELSRLLRDLHGQVAAIQERSNARRTSRKRGSVQSSQLAILHYAGSAGPF
jgi:DNA-binding transcriptional ArsR family regulator